MRHRTKPTHIRAGQIHLGDGGHLNRDMTDAEAGLRHPAPPDGYVVPQAMIAVKEAAAGGATVREHHVQD